MTAILGVGIAMLAVMVSFAGLVVALLLRLDRRIERIDERTNERIDRLADEMKELTIAVKVIAQNQALTDRQMKELTNEVKTIGNNQARMEGEIVTLKDVILHRSPERE